nr:hypothetical protein [uncultured Pedobacter sp.]
MVEVFSTNVKSHKKAGFLLYQLDKAFPVYTINFDLDDCENILRVQSDEEPIDASQIIALLKNFGFVAEVLPDIPNFKQPLINNTLSTTVG